MITIDLADSIFDLVVVVVVAFSSFGLGLLGGELPGGAD